MVIVAQALGRDESPRKGADLRTVLRGFACCFCFAPFSLRLLVCPEAVAYTWHVLSVVQVQFFSHECALELGLHCREVVGWCVML